MDRSNQNRELVYCHECENEWFRDEHGLICPACQSEFTEVIEADHDPREVEPEPETQSEPETNPFHDHNPWRNLSDSNDPNTSHWQYERSGPGMSIRGSFYSSTTTSGGVSRGGMNNQQNAGPQFPMMNPLSLFGGMMGNRSSAEPPAGQQFPGSMFRPQSAPGSRSRGDHGSTARPGGTRVEIFANQTPGGFTFTTHRTPGGPGQSLRQPGSNGAVDMNEFLNSIFRDIGQMQADGTARGTAGTNPAQMNPFAQLLSNLMNPANASSGDAVFTNEAFDRVMSELMEQHASGNAPGPASEAAISSLPKKAVSKDMCDEATGKAECSICMDNVPIGEEVTELPCKHWFHQTCIEAWLNEHDTCPHCRSGIMPKDGSRDTVRSPMEAPLHDEDPLNLVRRESGTRDHPFVVDDYPGSPSNQQRPSARRHSSSQEGSGGGISERVRNFFSSGNGGSQASRR